MARLDDLIAQRDAWEAKLRAACADATVAGGKPDNPSGVAHDKWLARCQHMVDWYVLQIAQEEGPIEQSGLGCSS